MKSDLTVSELFKAYYDCRKTKRNTWNALQFEENLERNLMDLYYELIENKYVPQRSICFIVTYPKAREVWAASFRDRIVHHILYNRYSLKFHNSFIYDSYACIPEKGTLKAANRVQQFIRSTNKNRGYYLKADIANFFVSIDKQILKNILFKKIEDEWWRYLTNEILFNNFKNNAIVKSNKKLVEKVPIHKSLLRSSHNLGLPIGNLSSQFFANIYLNELDQYVKHHLKVKRYVRYVDDIIIIDECPKRLHQIYLSMCVFVEDNLGLKFHPNKKEINHVDYGVNFTGYIIKRHCRYIRKSTLHNCHRKLKNISDTNDLLPVINSYLGMLKHTNSYKERLRIAKNAGFLGAWFNGKLTKMTKRGNYVHTTNEYRHTD